MVNIEFNQGQRHEVRDLRAEPIDPDIIRERVVDAYRNQQGILHPNKPKQLGIGQRILRAVLGEKRKEVRA